MDALLAGFAGVFLTAALKGFILDAWIVERDAEGLRRLAYRRDVPDLKAPPPAFVKIRLVAAGITPNDAALLDPPASLPAPIGGVEGAGVVEACGYGVEDLKVGMAVCLYADRRELGTFAQYMYAPAHVVAPLADGVSFEAAAALAASGLTAWQAVVHRGLAAPAEFALIDDVSPAAFLAAQMAVGRGAIVAAAGPNSGALKALGVSEAFEGEEAAARLLRLTEGLGVQLLIDGGGRPRNLGLLGYAGRYVSLRRQEALPPQAFSGKCLSFSAVDLQTVYGYGSAQEQRFFLRTVLEDLLAAVASGALRIPPHRVVPFGELPAALEEIRASPPSYEKTVLKISGEAA